MALDEAVDELGTHDVPRAQRFEMTEDELTQLRVRFEPDAEGQAEAVLLS